METLNNVVVDGVSIKGSRGSLKIGDTWYNAYNAEAAKIVKVEKGDVVTFSYDTKGSYKNIKGFVTKYEGKTPCPETSITTSPDVKSYHRNHGKFPIDPLDGQRSIIRQNALTNARELFAWYWLTSKSELPNEIDGIVENVIDIARQFEAYTAGDLDTLEAEEFMNEMNK